MNQNEVFRSHQVTGLVSEKVDLTYQTVGVRRTQLVTAEFAVALELVAEGRGVEITVAREGEPSWINRLRPSPTVSKGEAEVVLFEHGGSVANNKFETVIEEAMKLL